MNFTIEVSAGELIDQITILAIKVKHVQDVVRVSLVRSRLEELERALDESRFMSPKLDSLMTELKVINEALWQIEDEVRLCERHKNFGPQFIELSRSIYRSNDDRARIKEKIDLLFASTAVEVKVYPEY